MWLFAASNSITVDHQEIILLLTLKWYLFQERLCTPFRPHVHVSRNSRTRKGYMSTNAMIKGSKHSMWCTSLSYPYFFRSTLSCYYQRAAPDSAGQFSAHEDMIRTKTQNGNIFRIMPASYIPHPSMLGRELDIRRATRAFYLRFIYLQVVLS